MTADRISLWLPQGAHEVAPGVFRPGPAPEGYPRTLTAYRMDVWGSVDFLRGVLAVAAMFGLSQGKAWRIESYTPDVHGEPR